MTRSGLHNVFAAFIGALAVLPAPSLASDLPEALGNISYGGIYDEPVTLSAGRYEGEPFVPGGAARPRVSLLTQLYAASDIDGDGKEDAWVLLNENSGGTGQLLYLAAVSDTAGEPKNLGTVLIGDRVDVIDLRTENGDAVLEFVTTGPGEAACCPTLVISAAYGLREGRVSELSREERGHLTLERLSGTNWRLTHFSFDDPVPEGIAITARFDNGRITGHAGCNNYFVTMEAPTPYELSSGPVGSTRMACPPPQMEAEDRYLKALEKAGQFSYLLGGLAISYKMDDKHNTLIFERSSE